MSDFRPISLCNIVAKIIGKVMTNRLRGALTNIISETQSPFLPGRIISNNILIAHELLHFMNHRVRSKNPYMSLKLDMSKAYDRVEWKFLESIMLKFGFSRMLVDWTMCLVSFVSYSFLVNGAPREGLSCMLRDGEERKALTRVKISRESPNISHILFADDTMLFCKASGAEANEIMRILQDNEEASVGLIDNLNSSVAKFFGKNEEGAEEFIGNLGGNFVMVRAKGG
ncbi:hypothetical protein LIER_30347 [Lithospermum erythrorhizon]|uniref:Reverse transcriptase domain-containing protein n=1 Tax=Lithospermum erythrorhizon TaxID=34254 RepID=A0AAV3RP35_LITER